MDELMVKTEPRQYTNKTLIKATKEIDAIGDKIRSQLFKVAATIAAVDTAEAYKEDGFASVHEWVTDAFGWAKTRSYELLKIGREWTTTITDKTGKIIGYCSDIDSRYGTTQIGVMIPAGHELAAELHETGVINPGMTAKQLKKAIADAMKDETDETPEEPEETAETEETEETEDIIVWVHDDSGNVYKIPSSVLMQYKAGNE